MGDSSDDKKKDLERQVSDLEANIANTKEAITTFKSEIAALKAGIAALDDHETGKVETSRQLAATNKVISELHAECDFLLKYASVRAEARASEIDSLGNARAVLKGADYAL